MAQTARVIKLKSYAPATKRTSRDEKMARIILFAIESELAYVDFFTREDLLQLTVLQSVATITRYREVCKSVIQLVSSNKLQVVSRTELRLPKGRRVPSISYEYDATVDQYVVNWKRKFGDAPFSVMTIVDNWVTDQNLTTNAKRVIVRKRLRVLCFNGKLSNGQKFDYIAGKDI